jgi:transcriptional regulator
MYIPAVNRETDPAKLFEFIEEHNFGLLVSTVAGEPFATHLPFLLDRSAGPQGCLLGHVATANPHWRDAHGQTVLAVFSGPHAYVSPSWYEADSVVPTWNYVAVHVYGTLRLIDEPEALTQLLHELVNKHEAALPRPWQFDDTSDYSRKLMKAITGFRIDIARVEGKWKLSQNQPVERQAKVARALGDQADADARAIAALMTKER